MSNWVVPSSRGDGPAVSMRWRGQRVAQKLSYARVDENLVFVCFWLVAVVLAGLVTYLVTDPGAVGPAAGDLGVLEVLALAVPPLGTYAAVLAGTIAALVLTRKVVWRIIQLGLGWQRALPAPGKDRPPLRNS